MNNNTQHRANPRWRFWLVITACFFIFLFLIKSILLPFILGMFIAYLLDPVTDKLETRGYSRGLSTSLIIGGFFAVVFVLLVTMMPVIAKQLSGLIEALPHYIESFKHYYGKHLSHVINTLDSIEKFSPEEMNGLKEAANTAPSVAFKVGGSLVAQIFSSGLALVNLLSLILITPIVAFYLLRDWDRIVAHIDGLLPRQHAEVIREQMRIIDRTLAGFLRGQFNVCLILAVYYAIGLTLVGLKFGVVIGMATGFLCIFPYVGIMLGAGVGLAVALSQFGDLVSVGLVVAIFASGQIIEGNFITPKLVGDKVGLHPVWIIFGMLAGAALFGFVGILLAIPITAIIGVLIRFAIGRYKQSGYYQGNAHTPAAP